MGIFLYKSALKCEPFRLLSVIYSSLVTMVPEVPGGLVALSGGPSLLSLAAIDFGGKLKKKEIQRIVLPNLSALYSGEF